MTRRKFVPALAALFLLAHLASLPTTPDDIDAVNFALGVRDFDVALHQPHPPGYPLVIALGKMSAPVLRAAGVASPEVRGLALWSALGGAVLLVLLFGLWRCFDGNRWCASLATLMAGASPLVWFTALRPLSDLPGLCTGIAAVALLVRAAPPAWTSGGAAPGRRAAALLGGAVLTGLAAGFRSQTVLLTAPLLLLLLVTPQSGLPFRLRLGALGVLATGIALWAVPLVLASGGLTGYLLALGSQAGEDFSGVVMLWTHRTARVAALAVLHTLVLPWDSPALAGVMLALAGAGALLLVVRAPRRAALIALLFGPYALFHVLFQETETVRYALPLVVPVTYLASIPLAEARPIVSAAAASALIAVMLLLAVPAGVAYGRVPSPVFRALEHLETSDDAAVIGMHRRVSAESRRARQWSGAPRGELLAAPRDYEWLESTRVWRERDLPAAWFIADPRRTDLALFDPASQQRLEYRWPFRQRTYVGGARPDQVDLVKFVAPGWFLGPGWALTPEVAGITERDGWGPHKRPSVGWVRRRPGETVLMLGGRHLGSATSAPVQVSVAFDQRPVLTLDVQAGPFFGFHPLPAGALAGTGRYSELTATATAGGGASPPVAIEQFDLQDPGVVQLGFEEGWQEPEYNPRTGRSWRWMSERATLGVVSSGRDVTLRITGESSRRYFSRASRLSVAVGAETLATLELANDFTKEVTIPAAPLAKSNGRVTLGADQVFIPGDRKGSADRRRLAVRIYSVTPVAH